ncbi:hypothetical protein [Streptomyces sp. NPDC047014]|uniref:hypothetical protein n=1 Tax=Streptomyces sp. NPDC047014 TaxID=3155736 RepID=UPI0034050FB4
MTTNTRSGSGGPGESLVRDLLGVFPSTASMPAQAATLAGLIQESAYRLDDIQEQLQERATQAIDQLRNIAVGRDRYRRGSTDGVLQLTGLQVDMLAARRGDAVRHLTALCAAYQAVTRPAAPAVPIASPPSPYPRPAPRR